MGIDNTLDNHTWQEELVAIVLVAGQQCMVRVVGMTVQRSPEMELRSSCTQDRQRAVVTWGTVAHETSVEGADEPLGVLTPLVLPEA